jgi:N utilization substance protein B
MQNRRELREAVLKSLYAVEFSGESADEVRLKLLKHYLTDAKDTKSLDFMERLFFKAVDIKQEATVLIESKLQNWELERLASIDRLVMVMGIAEFLHFDDIPTNVSINECIELAKKYSTFKSGKFVNAVLESVLEELTSQGKITKKGRGLVQQRMNYGKRKA